MTMEPVTRRNVLKAGFWLGIGATGLAAAITFGRFFYAKDNGDASLTFVVSKDDVPEPGGEPFLHEEGGFYLVHLASKSSDQLPDGCDEFNGAADLTAGGLLALSTSCTHLNCSVRLAAEATSNHACVEVGTLDCRCHGGRFTTAGSVIFGPPPRALSTGTVSIASDGNVSVDMAQPKTGDAGNATRAVPYRPSTESGRSGRV